MSEIDVLWIDDQIENYSEFIRGLKDEDVNIYSAKNINEGILQLSKRRMDLILLDLNMPENNGFDFLTRVNNRSNIPICILSSYLHLSEYQKKISKIRKNIALLDKNIPQPNTEAFKHFSNRVRFYALNPPKYTPAASSKRLKLNYQSKDPFEISFRDYLNLPSKIKGSIREAAQIQAKETLEKEFATGRAWLLFCGDPSKPNLSKDPGEQLPTNQAITEIALDLDRVPFQFSSPDNVDDILTTPACDGPHMLSDYPTITFGFGQKKITAHFDSGSPYTFASFEELNELGVLGNNLFEIDGQRGDRKYEYYRDELILDVYDQKTGQKKRCKVNLRAIKNWNISPYNVVCPQSCSNFGGYCRMRKALVGHNILTENKISITLCGLSKKSSIGKPRK